jgi:nickel superoxide dismutase
MRKLTMIYKVLSTVEKFNAFKVVSAHCDIPCGIYDPSSAQIATLSAIRVLNLIQELQELSEKEKLSIQQYAKLVCLVDMKEVHAEQVKNEIRVIWGITLKNRNVMNIRRFTA